MEHALEANTRDRGGRRPLWRHLIGAMAVIATSVVASVAAPNGISPVEAAGGVSEAQVVDEFVAGGTWRNTVAADFLPDGRVLVVQSRGGVNLVDPVAGTTTWSFTVPNVYFQGESGLLDVHVDPSFATTRRFYLYMTDALTRKIRVDRYTLEATGGTTLATRTLVWEQPGAAVSNNHVGGSINIGPDGKLYITTGDNSVSANAQDLTNVFGKVLRINLDGSVPTDNPFFDGAGPNTDEIWAYGIRNGFRGSFDSTGTFYLGDVGGNVDTTAYEEVDVIERGKNYGWPLCEGPATAPKNGPVCPSGVTGPVFSYTHAIGQGCCQNKAIVGGDIYRGNSFPASFVGTYVYADYPTGTFYWVDLPTPGSEPTSGLLKTTSLAAGLPVWLGVSPVDGNIYWIHYGWDSTGQLRRLRYVGGTARAPVITQSSATPTTGAAPLSVSFTGAATDADGDVVSYLWDFGDGTTSTDPSPTKVYATDGVYEAQLAALSNGDVVTSAPITISVGSPPTVNISSPANGTVFRAGQTVTFTGSGSSGGTPLPGTSLTWNVSFQHNEHSHPVETATGSTYTLAVPTTGHGYEGDTGYVVTLTAVNALGLSTTTSVTIEPDKRFIPLSANVAGVVGTVDAVAASLPSTIDTLVGFEHVIEAPATVCSGNDKYVFSSWSDGGARSHTIVVPDAPLALSATYLPDGSCSPTPVGRWNFSEGAGTTTADATGNGNTGTLLNAIGWGAGKVGGGLSSTGVTNQHVRVVASPSIDAPSSSMTVMGWINPTALGTGRMTIASRQFGTAFSDQWVLGLNKGLPTFALRTEDGSGTGSDATSTTPVVAGTWTHVAGVYDGATMTLYVNGVAVASRARTGLLTKDANPLVIGGNENNTKVNQAQELFNGLLDEVALYDRALTPAQIGAAMSGVVAPPTTTTTTTTTTIPPTTTTTIPPTTTTTTIPPTTTTTTTIPPTTTTTVPPASGPIGRWNFDEGTGTSTADSSGNANNGTLLNAIPWGTGRAGASVRPTGVANQHVRVPVSASVDRPTSAMTVAAWVNPSAITYRMTIASRQLGTAYSDQWYLSLLSGTPNFGLNTTVGGNQSMLAGPALPVGQWTHVAAVWDGATMRVFVNGVPRAATLAKTGTLVKDTNPLVIGANENNAKVDQAQEIFSGDIDQVVLYDRALSDAEVAALAAG